MPMKPVLTDPLNEKLSKLFDQVRQRLEKSGIAIPYQTDNGSLCVGSCTVLKFNGLYQILDKDRSVIVDQINLPHTAIIIANSLALGRIIDQTVLNHDRCYGYALFEEQLFAQLAKKCAVSDPERCDLLIAKSQFNNARKLNYKTQILKKFETLKAISSNSNFSKRIIH